MCQPEKKWKWYELCSSIKLSLFFLVDLSHLFSVSLGYVFVQCLSIHLLKRIICDIQKEKRIIIFFGHLMISENSASLFCRLEPIAILIVILSRDRGGKESEHTNTKRYIANVLPASFFLINFFFVFYICVTY